MTIRYSAFKTAVGIDHPIVQGPMNGGSPLELTVAVSNAGALGSYAAALLAPAAIIENVAKIRALTNRPFNVNLFVQEPPRPAAAEVLAAQDLLAPFRAELGLGPTSVPDKFCEDFRDQVSALLEAAPPVVNFTFGILDSETVSRFKRAGSLVIGTATTVAEAQAWERGGADFICASGSEAGGHRATFLGDFEQSCIGLMALVPQVAAAVKIPVIAAGGIMNGRGIAASLMLGAQAAQLGTAFLSCPESGIAQAWRQQLQKARDDSTRLTRTFSGRYARGIVNQFMERMRPFEQEVPPYPVQNALTGEMRQAAAKLARPEFMSLWAGQGVAMARPMPAAELVKTLADELQALLPNQ
ncbi:NAD(P)H-dependent flavin oxidoreductase [Paraherbaspirillum soli]|uniref:Propionate 3-nitronate monooxygenase n=1 Tax=Paraherbaspirillum soli TaxID=631222 RepID=A0ABW0M6U2_9BURK